MWTISRQSTANKNCQETLVDIGQSNLDSKLKHRLEVWISNGKGKTILWRSAWLSFMVAIMIQRFFWGTFFPMSRSPQQKRETYGGGRKNAENIVAKHWLNWKQFIIMVYYLID